MSYSKIEWTGKTWNPLRAKNKETGGIGHFCEKVSAGCKNCYAENFQKRFRNFIHYGAGDRNKVELFLDTNVLSEPLRWKKPTVIFVCSMTDLFGEWVTDDEILQVFTIMALCPQHTFQVLTKRPERAVEYFKKYENGLDDSIKHSTDWIAHIHDKNGNLHQRLTNVGWWWDLTGDVEFGSSSTLIMDNKGSLPNVWIGTSVEDQRAADIRIPHLLNIPAAVRFLSCEPLIGPIDITQRRINYSVPTRYDDNGIGIEWTDPGDAFIGIDWVIVGGESGGKAVPMHPSWARSLRDQCEAAEVVFFFKQHGSWAPVDRPHEQENIKSLETNERWLNITGGMGFHADEVYRMRKVGKKAAGRLLDGVEYNGMPTVTPVMNTTPLTKEDY